MNNKKSLLQDSLQELENIKNESLELAKEQLINESADLLEKKSAALFEKLIAGEDTEEESSKDESDSVNEVLDELKKSSEEEEEEEEEEGEDEEDEESEDEEGEEKDDDDIEFDDDEFSDVDVDDKVLVEPSDDEEEESTQKINENFKRKNTKMKNKKQVLKDLRDVSFNKLVEAYYNMDEEDSFVVSEEMYDEGYDDEDEMPDYSNIGQLEEYGIEDEDVMYEIDMPEGGYDMESMTDEDINEMLSEMGSDETMHDVEEASGMSKMQPKREMASKSELEEMFEEMSIEELEEMNAMLQEDGDMEEGGDYRDNDTSGPKMSGKVRFETNPDEDYMSEEQEIEEMLSSMDEGDYEEEGIEESSAVNTRTMKTSRNMGADEIGQGRPDRRSKPTLAEEEMEEVESLHEQIKKLKAENKALNEGFTNKVKSLENKVYDVTISALKAGFVNKFLLEHPLRENEKLQIIHRFANAQTKEQIKETYISLTNEFAKGQTVKDGSMLNESVQNKVGKVHRTDNAIVTEKNLMNESDESNRFKQLLNYNFGKKK